MHLGLGMTLDLAYCVSLRELPHLPQSLKVLDLSYYSSDSIAESLVRVNAELHQVRPCRQLDSIQALWSVTPIFHQSRCPHDFV